MKIIVRVYGLLAGLAACAIHPAYPDEFPNRPVTIVVPYPAGGGVDLLARALSEQLAKKWNQSVIVENKGGAASMIGGNFVARANPDGYTLLLTSDSTITSNPFLFKTLPFDPMTAFAPVTELIELHQVIVAHPTLKPGSLKELVSYSNEHPNSLNYGSYGSGSQPNLVFETLKAITGAKIVQVPFKGVAPAITATLANQVQITLGGVGITGGYIKTGMLKALAIGNRERLKSFPEIPTFAEAGFPDIDPQSWFGLFAPAGVPRDVVGGIQNDVARILEEPDFRERFIESAGNTAVGSKPDAFSAFLKLDYEYKRKLIATAGIPAE